MILRVFSSLNVSMTLCISNSQLLGTLLIPVSLKRTNQEPSESCFPVLQDHSGTLSLKGRVTRPALPDQGDYQAFRAPAELSQSRHLRQPPHCQPFTLLWVSPPQPFGAPQPRRCLRCHLPLPTEWQDGADSVRNSYISTYLRKSKRLNCLL